MISVGPARDQADRAQRGKRPPASSATQAHSFALIRRRSALFSSGRRAVAKSRRELVEIINQELQVVTSLLGSFEEHAAWSICKFNRFNQSSFQCSVDGLATAGAIEALASDARAPLSPACWYQLSGTPFLTAVLFNHNLEKAVSCVLPTSALVDCAT